MLRWPSKIVSKFLPVATLYIYVRHKSLVSRVSTVQGITLVIQEGEKGHLSIPKPLYLYHSLLIKMYILVYMYIKVVNSSEIRKMSSLLSNLISSS